MASCIKMEIKKAFKNKYFYIALSIMLLFSILSARYTCSNFLKMDVDKNFSNGEMIENEIFPVYTSFHYWIGSDEQSVIGSLFFLLLPVFAVLPFSWSYHIERKSGYIKQVLSRSNKASYFLSKMIAVFISGAIVVLIPLILNFLIVSTVYPSSVPQVNYIFYNHVNFGTMWADLFFSYPGLYVLLYILLNAVFAGLFALTSFAISFFIKNRVAIIFSPFILCVGLNYFGNFLASVSSQDKKRTAISPITFLRSTDLIYITSWHLVLFFALTLAVFSMFFITFRGKRDDVF